MKIRVKKYLSTETEVVNLTDYIEGHLGHCGYEDGALEAIARQAANNSKALASMMECLCKSEALSRADVLDILNDNYTNSEAEFIDE